jgi:hypothetical protein
MPRILHGALLAALYAVYLHLHITGVSPTSQPLPWSTPRRPLLLHEFLLPQLLLFLALTLPITSAVAAAIFLPPICASLWALLGAGSSSPALGYAAGTFVAVYLLKSLEVLIFRDARLRFRRFAVCGNERAGGPAPADTAGGAGWALEIMHSLRGPGWNWCIPCPRTPRYSRTRWILTRLLRGLVVWAWLDFLVYYVRTADRDFFLPKGHATGFLPPDGGVPYPALFTPGTKPLLDYPPPLGFPAMPADARMKRLYQLALLALRTLLGASAIFAAIEGMYTATALIFVVVGLLVGSSPGWKARWFAPEAWPDAFGRDFGHGVRGFWGRGWHGLFRSLFTAPAHWVVSVLGIEGTTAAKTLHLIIPFVCSAILHFAGCWTQAFGGWGAARFFLLQPLGIVVESLLMRGRRRWWAWYLWATVWFVVTAVPFFEEYRWGGLWVVEPIPASVMRGRTDLWTTQPGGRAWWRWARPGEGGWAGEYAVVIGGSIGKLS